MSSYPMKLIIFAWLLVFTFTTDSFAQPGEVSLQRNAALFKNKSSNARSFDPNERQFYIPLNGSFTFCPEDYALLELPVDSVHYSICEGLTFGETVEEGMCLSYSNLGSLGADKICLEVFDSLLNRGSYLLSFQSVPTINLPFIEDFAYNQDEPSSAYWTDKRVFINHTLSEDPLSIGVATFDGLDNSGTPYPGGFGFSDELTSNFVDLQNEQEVYFSFFFQPKGYGIKPRTTDSLVLEFRTLDDRWIRMWSQEGLPNSFPISDPAPAFAFHRLVIPDSFLISDFQFRFRNKSKNEGLQELWHLDYVRVGNEEQTRETFRDIAFTDIPVSILSPYTNMPSSQFVREEVRGNALSSVRNLDVVDLTMNDPTIEITGEGMSLMRRTFIEPAQLWLLSPGLSQFDFELNFGGSTNVQLLQDGLEDLLADQQPVTVTSTMSYTRQDEIIDANRNNTVSRKTVFGNYFSYDDGSAETAIIDRGSGFQSTTLAMEYHANQDDELQGVQIHIPHIEGDVTSQRFNLMVWLDSLGGDPVYLAEGVRPYYVDQFYDSLQGFTTYDLRDSLDEKITIDIPAGKFYIGWEQVSLNSVKIPIGYDINSPEGSQFFYFNAGNGWMNVGATGVIRPGALMIRPVVGNEPVIPTSTEDVQILDIALYPNPGRGKLFVKGIDPVDRQNWTVEVYSLTGQQLLFQKLPEILDISNYESGTYVVKLRNRNGKGEVVQKIMILN